MNRPGIAQQTNLKASRKNIPLSVFAEITRACNHRCYYCYQQSHAARHELTFGRWKSLFGELAEAGTMYIAFSGGEPFLRDDFLRILKAARNNDFAVSVITNGTRIDRRSAMMLADMGVMDVGVSFLAATSGVHDRLTGRTGSYERALRGVRFLIGAGVKVLIKHCVSNENFGQYRSLEKMAVDEGCLFEVDGSVLPSRHGEVSPFALTEEQQRTFLSDMDFRPLPSCRKGSSRSRTAHAARWSLHCDAGRSICGITASGDVVPCIILPIPFGNIQQDSFIDLWHGTAAQKFRRQEARLETECEKCSMHSACSRCHAAAYRETGNWRGKSPGLCVRARALSSLTSRVRSGHRLIK